MEEAELTSVSVNPLLRNYCLTTECRPTVIPTLVSTVMELKQWDHVGCPTEQ